MDIVVGVLFRNYFTFFLFVLSVIILSGSIYYFNNNYKTIAEKYKNYRIVSIFVSFLILAFIFPLFFNFLIHYLSPDLQFLLSLALFVSIVLLFNFITEKIILRPFVCPFCLKSIDIVREWKCPFCDCINKRLITSPCKKCKDKLPAYNCPHCYSQIDLTAPYNEKELKRKRYEKV